MIQIYYGNGKGKTTAAIGAGMRAYGAGKRVLLVQFFKDNKSSELASLPFDVVDAPDSLPFNPGAEYKPWVDSAIESVKAYDGDVIILDEFLDLIPSFLSVKDAMTLLDYNKEYIITGHRTIQPLFELADYITLMKKEKHPYDLGIKARKGIEY